MDKLLTTKEVSQLLNVEPQTVRRMAAAGHIPSIRLNTGVRPHYRFDKATLEAWIRRQQ